MSEGSLTAGFPPTESFSQRISLPLRQLFCAYPGRIANDYREASGRENVRRVDFEREERKYTVSELPSCSVEFSTNLFECLAALSLRFRQPDTLPKQISALCGCIKIIACVLQALLCGVH